jgi:hypothetical protein
MVVNNMSCDVSKERLRVAVLLALAVAATLVRVALADVRVLHADLSFHFVCKEKDRASLEEDIDRFLRQQGFKVLNKSRIQREHGFSLSVLEIIGLDDKRRTIRVHDVPSGEGRYSVGLNTPPPTKHASQLEDALLEFASNTLGCEVRQVTRGENAEDTADLYSNTVRRVENLFRQAEQLHGKWRL